MTWTYKLRWILMLVNTVVVVVVVGAVKNSVNK